MQLSLDFGKTYNYDEADFIISDSNRLAYQYIANWPNWPSGLFGNILLLTGEKCSGKTFLANIFAQKSNGVFLKDHHIYDSMPMKFIANYNSFILEDLDYIEDEVKLLHFINFANENKRFLLLTSSTQNLVQTIKLPDLKSRFASLPSLAIELPDDNMIKSLLQKGFSDRQLKVSLEVINYLYTRIDRSFRGVEKIIDKIDRRSKEEKRNITIPLLNLIIGGESE